MKCGNIKKDNFEFIIKPNEENEFSHFLLVNGLYVKNGGTPIEFLVKKIVYPIREKLKKKYPNIKISDVKGKIKIYLNMRFFKNLKFNGQTKEEIKNNIKDFEIFFEKINWDKVVKDILKDEVIMGLITDYFELKEQAKENAKLRELSKTKKKINSDKYYPATKSKKYLFIAEGASASGSMMKILGREEYGFYELKGKPLNVYDASATKFSQNKELRELLEIIISENYDNIVILSDNDLDGISIAGLLIVFFFKFLSNYLKLGKVFRFYTPIAASINKSKKLLDWVYKFDEIQDLKGNIKYYKGLGSWTPEQLEQVIKKDGFNSMLMKLEYIEEDAQYIDKWFNTKKADERKDAIVKNKFDIIKL